MDKASYYQSLIGILRWVVKLGGIDIYFKVSMMATCVALPRYGHLNDVYCIFDYLQSHHNAEMVLTQVILTLTRMNSRTTIGQHRNLDLIEKILPGNMSEPRGQGMIMRCFVNADPASDSITRISRTGFVVYLNTPPIY